MKIRRAGQTYLSLIGIAACVAAAGGSWLLFGQSGDAERAGLSSAASAQIARNADEASPASVFPVTIRRPGGPPRVDLGVTDADGNAVTAACSSCHAARPPERANRTAEDLDEFHQGLKLQHGGVACLSCHNPNDYDSLKLADGAAVAYVDVMTLCAQCHGPEMKDYEHGAHGGMTGYWDLRRGPRMRNNCIDCHDPHAPAFTAMIPTFKPRDRFLNPAHDAQANHHE